MRSFLFSILCLFLVSGCDSGGTSGGSYEPISPATIGGEWEITQGVPDDYIYRRKFYDFRVTEVNGGRYTSWHYGVNTGGGWHLEGDTLTLDNGNAVSGKVSGTGRKFTFTTPAGTSVWTRT